MLRSLCGRMKPMRGLGFKIEAARSDPQCAQSGNGGWFSDQDRGAAVLLRPHLTALVTSTFLPLSRSLFGVAMANGSVRHTVGRESFGGGSGFPALSIATKILACMRAFSPETVWVARQTAQRFIGIPPANCFGKPRARITSHRAF